MTGAHRKTSSGLIAALCVHLLAPAAFASAPAQFDHVIVALQTQQGYDKGVLDPLQLYAEVPQADPQALRVALNEPELYSGFALALACPHSPRYEQCRDISVLRDTQVRRAIDKMPQSSILVVKPAAGVTSGQAGYRASLQVTLLSPGGRKGNVLRRFTVVYRDFDCAGSCLKTAHENAARELAEMTTYMINVGFGAGPNRNPPSWKSLPSSDSVKRWDNNCVKGDGNIVSIDRPRAWLAADTDVPMLTSYAWSGCR